MAVDTIFCSPSICMPNPWKSKNIIFFPSIRKSIKNNAVQPVRALEHPKCLFLLKWPKYPLLALGLTEGQTWSGLSQKNIFHSFTSNPRFSKIFNKLWPSWTKFDPKSISSGSKNSNLDPASKMDRNQYRCKDYRILIPTTIHGSKSKLEWSRYLENCENCVCKLLRAITFDPTVGFLSSIPF